MLLSFSWVDIKQICLFVLLSSSIFRYENFYNRPLLSLRPLPYLPFYIFVWIRNNNSKMIYLLLNALYFPFSWKQKRHTLISWREVELWFIFKWMPTIKKDIRYLNSWFQHIFHFNLCFSCFIHSQDPCHWPWHYPQVMPQTLTLPSGRWPWHYPQIRSQTFTLTSGKVTWPMLGAEKWTYRVDALWRYKLNPQRIILNFNSSFLVKYTG